MSQDRTLRLRSIFDAAAELPEPDRLAYVRSACADDPALAQEVLSLLRALDGQGHLLDDALPVPASAGEGVHVGSFTLVRLLGAGASGSVYEAEQSAPRRRVALKLLKSWDVTPEGRRRFVEEANILARLQHPGIAQVFAAGVQPVGPGLPAPPAGRDDATASAGVSWIAMELVEGAQTLTAHSAAANLTLPLRLELFASVCDAVNHGHTRGVIHRDLKPHNILVGANGVPKVIDFGVARAIHDGAGGAEHLTRRTVAGDLIGTLRYMSPEQCDGQAMAADTRTDVYALGVILYELCTGGAAPHALDGLSLSAAARTVCEAPVIPPRRAAPGLPRDLETIILKALEREPARRYQGVAELAADVRRFLAREPILARPSTAAYRIASFARRRPAAMGLATLALLGLIAGIIGISVGLGRERIARRESELRRDQAERQAWLANLFAADSALTRGDGGAALRRLAAIPPDRRGWEWRHLAARADESRQSWAPLPAPTALQLSPSGRLVASHAERELQLFSVDGRAHRWTTPGVPKGGEVLWSPDERAIAVTGIPGIAIVDAATGAVTRRLANEGETFALGGGWSPDGRRFVAGCSRDYGIQAFDVATGQRLWRVASAAWVYNAQFSPDGREVAWSDATDVCFADAATGQVRRRAPIPRAKPTDPSVVGYSPDGRRLSATCGNLVAILDPAGVAPRILLRAHDQRTLHAAFDPSGDRLVTSSVDRTLRLWDLTAAPPILPRTLLGHDAPAYGVQFLPSLPGAPPAANTPVIGSADEHGILRWWTPDAGGPVMHSAMPGARSFVSHLAFYPDGSRLACVIEDAIMIWDMAPRPHLARSLTTGHAMQRVLGGDPCVVRADVDATITCATLDTGNVRWTRNLKHPILHLEPSPDGRWIAAAPARGPVAILRTADGGDERAIDPGPIILERLKFSPDGNLLALRGTEGQAQLWDLRTGARLRQLCPDGDAGAGMAFSRDGSRVAYCDVGGRITLWDIRAARPIIQVGPIDDIVWCLAISPDGSRLAAGARDRLIHLFSLTTGDELLQLREHTGTVMSLAWSPDGRHLASGSYDQCAYLYDAPP